MGIANHAPNSTQLHPPVSKSGVRFLKFLPKNPFVGEIWAEKTFPVYSHLRHIDEKYYVFLNIQLVLVLYFIIALHSSAFYRQF